MTASHPSAVEHLSVKVPAVFAARLRENARANDRTLSSEIRRAIRTHLERTRQEDE